MEIWFKAPGDRWQPLATCRSLPMGDYCLAGRLTVPHKFLHWQWKFFSTSGKVQEYNFQGRTNERGLISLLDLRNGQAGTWQLNATCDLFDQLCGDQWQVKFQFQVVPQANPVIVLPKPAPEPEGEKVTDVAVAPVMAAEVTPPPRQAPSVSPAQTLEVEPENNVPREETEVDLEVISPALPETEPDGVAIAPVPVNLDETKQLAPEETPELVGELSTPVIETETELELEPIELKVEAEATATSPHFPPLRTINYMLELTYPELPTPIQVDITLMLDDRKPKMALDLPDPKRMNGFLRRQTLSRRSPLPARIATEESASGTVGESRPVLPRGLRPSN